MEVSGNVLAPAALPHAKEPAVSIEQKAGHFGEKYLHSLPVLRPQFVGRPAHAMQTYNRYTNYAVSDPQMVSGKGCRPSLEVWYFFYRVIELHRPIHLAKISSLRLLVRHTMKTYGRMETELRIRNRGCRWKFTCGAYGGGQRCAQGVGGKPEGKRPLGSPRRRWEDNIKINLQEVGGGSWGLDGVG